MAELPAIESTVSQNDNTEDAPIATWQLDHLPMDALHSIFTYLPIDDLRAVQFLCKHFNEAVEMQYHRVYQRIELSSIESTMHEYPSFNLLILRKPNEDSFDLDRLEVALQRIGRYIVNLTVETTLFLDEERILFGQLIGKYCTQLEHFHIVGKSIFNDPFGMNTLHRLKSLTFSYMGSTDKNEDLISEYLNYCNPEIMESLTLHFIPEIKGWCLLHDNIKNLKSLSLFDNNNLEVNYVYEYLQMNGKLRNFEFNSVYLTASIPRLCLNLNDLEHLSIDVIPSDDAFGSDVKILPGLKKLNISQSVMQVICPVLRDELLLTCLILKPKEPLAPAIISKIEKWKKLRTLKIVGAVFTLEGDSLDRNFNFQDLLSHLPLIQHLSLLNIKEFSGNTVKICEMTELRYLDVKINTNTCNQLTADDHFYINQFLCTLSQQNRLHSLCWQCEHSIQCSPDTIEQLKQFTNLKRLSYRLSTVNMELLMLLCGGAIKSIEHLELTCYPIHTEDTGYLPLLKQIILAAPRLKWLQLWCMVPIFDKKIIKTLQHLRPDLCIEIVSTDADLFFEQFHLFQYSHWNYVKYSTLRLDFFQRHLAYGRFRRYGLIEVSRERSHKGNKRRLLSSWYRNQSWPNSCNTQ